MHLLAIILILRPRGRGAKYCDLDQSFRLLAYRISMSVCLSVRPSATIFQKTHVYISRNSLYMLPTAVARSSSDDNSKISYVLPVLWMTSCCHRMVHIQLLGGSGHRRGGISTGSQLAANDLIDWHGRRCYCGPGAKSAVSDYLVCTVDRSSSENNVIRYVFPVLWMTSCFHIMGRMGQNQSDDVTFGRVHG